jgi:hypothetical protein
LSYPTNQLTHFYSRKKNTGEMVKLADALRLKYRGYRTLYLSWDAASWHVSKELADHLDKVNSAGRDRKARPSSRTMPLPAGAQFLNVIESVFSGMARAIIHNSDYSSPVAATEAIDRHIEERNAHFRLAPAARREENLGPGASPEFLRGGAQLQRSQCTCSRSSNPLLFQRLARSGYAGSEDRLCESARLAAIQVRPTNICTIQDHEVHDRATDRQDHRHNDHPRSGRVLVGPAKKSY